MSQPIVKVCMDTETLIKGLTEILYRNNVEPDTMGHVLNYTVTAVNLDEEQAAVWITEEVARINEEAAQDEQVEESQDEAPEESSDKEA